MQSTSSKRRDWRGRCRASNDSRTHRERKPQLGQRDRLSLRLRHHGGLRVQCELLAGPRWWHVLGWRRCGNRRSRVADDVPLPHCGDELGRRKLWRRLLVHDVAEPARRGDGSGELSDALGGNPQRHRKPGRRNSLRLPRGLWYDAVLRIERLVYVAPWIRHGAGRGRLARVWARWQHDLLLQGCVGQRRWHHLWRAAVLQDRVQPARGGRDPTQRAGQKLSRPKRHRKPRKQLCDGLPF